MAELNLPVPGVTQGPQWAVMVNDALAVLAEETVATASGQAAVFWGVFEEGSEPTPPADGKVHFGFRMIRP